MKPEFFLFETYSKSSKISKRAFISFGECYEPNWIEEQELPINREKQHAIHIKIIQALKTHSI